jgi:hypothetical protein
MSALMERTPPKRTETTDVNLKEVKKPKIDVGNEPQQQQPTMQANSAGGGAGEDDLMCLDPATVSKIVYSRNGTVLGKGDILKIDHYVDQEKSEKELQLVVSGAPNFRKAEGFSIYGVGQPTVKCTFLSLSLSLSLFFFQSQFFLFV